MKIILLGEFSSLHLNLRDGLRELGHHAVVASAGDEWKKIESDIFLGWPGAGWKNRILRHWNFISSLRNLTHYDVVQIMNPAIFGTNPIINRRYFDHVLRNNGKSFLLAAGDDSYYWEMARNKLRYSPLDDYLKFDHEGEDIFWLQPKMIRFNKRLAEQVNGIIPIMYDYYAAYEGHRNLKAPIPIPVNIKQISYRENKVNNGRLVVFHGLNREGFKGTHYVRDAFETLRKRYPNDLELVIAGKFPYQEYIRTIERVNVVVDQTSSYGWGVNAAISLALGKVVLSGAEPEALKLFGLTRSPVINLLPDPEDIVRKIEALLEERDRMEEFGMRSRVFAEDFHDHVRIASKYVSEWVRN